ncbi:hypothetical protein [Bacillus cereus]|uniref:hypothetical protein n=1 Tax=Bacillus cereus TaxID=1396 RepID=UPI0009ABCBB4|nr:hypothetical protein [Bacillus cereus]
MKCRLFLDFLLVILLGGCIGKEVTLYTISKGDISQCIQRCALLPVSYPTKLPFQANSFSFKQFIH